MESLLNIVLLTLCLAGGFVMLICVVGLIVICVVGLIAAGIEFLKD